jgi:hypothetical protein
VDREGNSVDRALIKEVLETVYELQSETPKAQYNTDFEPLLLDSSCLYYQIKMEQLSLILPYQEYQLQV